MLDTATISSSSPSWEPLMSNARCCKFSNCGKYLAIARQTNLVEIWNVETIHLPMLFLDSSKYVAESAACVDVCWSPDSNQVSAAFVHTISRQETNDQQPAVELGNNKEADASSGTVYSSDSVLVVWSVVDMTVRAAIRCVLRYMKTNHRSLI